MEPEEYIQQLNMREVATIMKLKLNMVETKANFPNKYDDRMCIMCKREEETTDHLFKCETYRRLSNNQLAWNDHEEGGQWKDVEWLKEAAKVVERVEEIRKREMNRLL